MENMTIDRKELTREISRLCTIGMVMQETIDGEKRYLLVTEDALKKRVLRLLLVKMARREIDEDTFLHLEEELLK